MQTGLVSILTDESVNFVAENGLAAMEIVMLAPPNEQTEAHIAHLKSRNVEVSGLIFSFDYLSADKAVAEVSQRNFYAALDYCQRLGGDLLTTVTGIDATLSLDDNLKKMVDVFGPMVDDASNKGIRVALENCPGHATFATSIENLEKIYTALDSPYFGLELDPSHFVWQGIDYLEAVKIFKDRIFRIHAKDTEVFDDILKRRGI